MPDIVDHDERIIDTWGSWYPGPAHPMATLRLIACYQIETALRQTADRTPDDAVHQLRRFIKQLRAVIALAEAAAVSGASASAWQARTIHRSLATARDHRILADLVTALRHQDDMAGLKSVLEHLAAANADSSQAPKPCRSLLAARRALTRLPATIGIWACQDDQWPSPVPGLGQGIAATIRAMEHAQRHNDDDGFHRWRRRIKTLASQLGLLTWIPAVAAVVPELGAIGHALGLEHDLSLLIAQSGAVLSTADHRRLLMVLRRRQVDLRRPALAAGHRLRPVLEERLLPAVIQAWSGDDGRSFTSSPGM